MKKQIAALLMSTSLVLPMTAVASANSSPAEDVSVTEISSDTEVTITNLGPSASDAFFASNPSTFTDNYSSPIISPMDTDGQNISYEFDDVSYYVWSKDPLPTHRYGKIKLTVVQTTNIKDTSAVVEYQFTTKDGKKKSEAIQVVGNLTKKSQTITFYDVPQGTKDNPVYLLITNRTDGDVLVDGNGYTS